MLFKFEYLIFMLFYSLILFENIYLKNDSFYI